MAQPTFLGEGTSPRVHDTRWRILVKIVSAAYNNASSPSASDIPTVRDTRWKLIEKWNRIKAGY
jgi:hypothetical protein